MRKKIGQIQSIWRYPVKSMKGCRVIEGILTKDGLQGDRMWTLWDEINKELVGAKQFNKIMQLKAAFANPNHIATKPDVTIQFPDDSIIASGTPYLNDVLSAFIGHPLSLKFRSDKKNFYLKSPESKGLEKLRQILGMPPTDSMKNMATFSVRLSLILLKYATPPKRLHDAHPIHFLTTNTLDWLKEAHPTADIDVRRFRPTFLIDSLRELGDYPESQWQRGYLEIGNTVIQIGAPTIRCSMPAQAQPELKEDIEVAKAIQMTAKQFVGSYGSVIESGKIVEGDEVMYRPARKIWQMQANLARKMREPIVTTLAKFEPKFKKKTKSKSTKETLEGSGFEAFKVVKIVEESKLVKSFYLQGSNFYSFLPGQHLIVGLDIPNYTRLIIRAYSISNYSPQSKTYRISVKRESKNALVSNYLHDKFEIGNTLYVKRPRGQFFLHPQEERPIALISIGVGITPFMSMLEYAQKINRREKISFFYGCQNDKNHLFKNEIGMLKKQTNIETYTCYSQPKDSETEYQKEGRIDIKTIQGIVNSVDTVFYLCGTDEFMRSMYWDLIEWGVKPKDINYEHFSKSNPIETTANNLNQASYEVHFSQSNLKATWSNSSKNVLELAESCGLQPDFGCRYGICNACRVNLKAGSIIYDDSIPGQNSNKSLLLCCAIPTSDIVVEL